ncbi:hypothetical protein [Desulfovibrio sp. ZJ200]|uniref:hypothetical protein n=1 Tax=Desulfovibrio sp. ZJ200 TaxID=2709792 RepID=UPI00197D6459|nr:hypothetical protein [Desulfovibrio sp. ZJ200]
MRAKKEKKIFAALVIYFSLQIPFKKAQSPHAAACRRQIALFRTTMTESPNNFRTLDDD